MVRPHVSEHGQCNGGPGSLWGATLSTPQFPPTGHRERFKGPPFSKKVHWLFRTFGNTHFSSMLTSGGEDTPTTLYAVKVQTFCYLWVHSLVVTAAHAVEKFAPQNPFTTCFIHAMGAGVP